MIQNINSKILEKLKLNQWHNTANVINWFKNIENKSLYTFTVFDIEEFYPSITENLLKKALDFAKTQTKITQEQLKLIFHCRKSLLYDKNEAWVKQKGNMEFDVTMGSYDGAEVCELVGMFLLNELSKKYNKTDIGLYRDDGLAIFKNTSGPQNERIKKDLISSFKKHDLKIEIKCNLKATDYLDVTFNLTDGTYKPFSKPNNTTRYINSKSNHPPNIIKQLPKSIGKRISINSSNEEIFNNCAPHYNNILKNCGYNEEITFTNEPLAETQNSTNGRKNRKRNIIWYNPPFSKNVKTNVAKKFLGLINKHFPKEHKYHKIFNRNNVKVSYSCMPNMKKILNSHNKKILSNKTSNIKTCNCRQKDSCPLDGNCLSTNIIYKATVSTNTPTETKIYIGLCETEFKSRYANHNKAFRHRKYEHETELSKHIWSLKDENKEFKIEWSIIKRATSYSPTSKTCNLCLTEKLMLIIERDKDILLNKRSEIVSKCRHQNKFILKNISTR